MAATQRSVFTAVFRGALARCPHCGRGRLFHAYLKQVDACAECSEAFGGIRADDGPAWLTILVVGHVAGAVALYTETHASLPVWFSILAFAGLTVALALLVLPRAKGMFIGAIWALKAPDSQIR